MHYIYFFFTEFDWQQFVASFLLLFAALDTPGNIPVVISIKKRVGTIQPAKITITSGSIMLAFLAKGHSLLHIFCIDEASFSVAGGIILFLLGIEMTLGIDLFKIDKNQSDSSIIPLAFPIIAGAGTMATLLTLKTKYAIINILYAIFGNLIVVYLVLRYVDWIQHKLGDIAVGLSQKIMGLILIAIAVKLIRTHFFIPI